MNELAVRHRLTAILAADAAGFSRLMAVDESATVAALDAARAVFRKQIEDHQGRVVDMAGDSVLAVFETAAGAVVAALAIQQSLRIASEAAPLDRRMRFRIGVHLGDVVEKDDGTVYGDGVNVAARLEGLAEPGGITVSDAVRGVVSGRVHATFIDRGEQHLKNIFTPIHAFAIDFANDPSVASKRHGVGAAARPSQVDVAPRAEAPRTAAQGTEAASAPEAPYPSPRPSSLFVGRQQEMAHLTKALADARQGQGQVVLLAGSGGIGKTRLAQQMARRAEQDGVSVLWGRCLEEPGAPLYWPWRQLIRGYLRRCGDANPAETLGAGLADIASIVPELTEQISPPQPSTDTGDTAQSRFRLFDAVAGFWRRAAQRGPLLLIFEDLHWADATSLRLFAFLAAELEDSALLVIGTYRDTELSRQHPLFETLAGLARSPAFHRIELAGLSGRETEEFMVAAGGGPASANFLSAIHERTEGHPLYLEEILRLMMETRAPQAVGSVTDDPRLLMRIPTGVREVIGKRLNRLSVSAGRLLSIAACIGRSFDLDLLAQLEADKSEDEVLLALEEALAVRLIEPVPKTQQFRFSHALIRETVYDEMLGLRRVRLHLRIGEMLERRCGLDDSTVLPQLAYHFSEAGPGSAAVKALAYARQAAEHAKQLFAFEEAVRLYQLALHLQEEHFAKDAAQRCGLLLDLGEVEWLLGTGEQARAAYREAAELARLQSLGALFARAAVGFEKSSVVAARSGEPAVALLLEAIALHQADDPLRVELLARLGRAYVYCARADEAKEAHHRAVTLARKIGDMRGLRLALASIATGIYWPSLLHERLAAAHEAWNIAEEMRQPLLNLDVLSFFLLNLIAVGDMPSLTRMREQGLRLSEQSGSPHGQAVCRCIEALVAINEGRFADAEDWATQALELGRRVAEDLAVGTYGMQMFCLRREQGRLREALPLLQHFVGTTPKAQIWQPGLALLYAELDMRPECQAQFDSLPWSRALAAPTDASTMTIALFAAEVSVYLEDAARAALLYPLLHGHAGTNLLADSGGPCLGSADRLLGRLATVMGQWEVAQRHFEAALAMDHKTGWRVWLAHSRYAYAVMLHRRASAGDLDRARTLLADALAESTALAMDALTPRIAALAEAIAKPRPAFPCGLTEREVGVLRLMAMGRNNREIGQVLMISSNTVANHVRSILEKTYTANRTEAAAFASREGLLK
ncbi:AAA family ATPase [Variovorax guangxiensis]|uniref:helix-turn-helix transcriptional regulator n=1 Tax=Variovorax guangxiensis TaxID=1775474 RepID=UPI002858CB13|nr:AAA family ATPase [Variovorax guangxiensis]MDR6860144.1 class 3 adenylate cyclase/DNA-binding CsgD family transcriptional regulator/tetratricopeptide (TPR) repeat protein [Variovorax guangxiensis]